jgi:uncharacterized protein (TIGR02996 family)
VLAILYRLRTEQFQRYTTERTRISIGRDPASDLVLADPTVSPRHLRMTEQDGTWIAEDLGSKTGTLVHGERIQMKVVVRTGDQICVGAYVVQLQALDHRVDPIEERLLDDIARGDDTSRAVYADWLEERGEVVRAEFVRLQQAIIQAPMATAAERDAFLTSSTRLRKLAASIDLEWRMRVARPAVEGCQVAFEIPCKMDWGQLEPTAHPKVRTCQTCRKNVHYCTSEQDAFDLAEDGHCVVVDIRQVSVRCASCGRDNPRQSAACLGCGMDFSIPRSEQTVRQSEWRPMGGMAMPRAYTPPAPPRIAPPPLPPIRAPLGHEVCARCKTTSPPAYQFCGACGAPLAPDTLQG